MALTIAGRRCFESQCFVMESAIPIIAISAFVFFVLSAKEESTEREGGRKRHRF